jgi:hypothetical protein
LQLPGKNLFVGHDSVLIKAHFFGCHWQHGPKHAPIMGFLLDSIADCKFALEQTPEAGFQIMHESPTSLLSPVLPLAVSKHMRRNMRGKMELNCEQTCVMFT